jgi:FkbM family methyltransferase
MMLKNFEHHLKVRKGAIHVGANVGEERFWYVNQGFEKVLWFEPNKEIYPILEDNISIYPNHDSFNFGIHDTLKSGTLHIANNHGQSSSLLELGTHAVNHPDVKYIKDQEIVLRRLDWFFEATWKHIEDYNFFNVDVQGVELNVIKSFGELIKKMDYIYAEVNEEEVYKGCACICDIDEYLHNYGFKRVETIITKAKWGDALYIKE